MPEHKIDNKRKCAIEGCLNVGRRDKVVSGKVYRQRLCDKHHRKKYPLSRNSWKWKGHFEKCILCGWDGPCDMHRKESGGKYTKENVLSICPNCHRLIHRGLLCLPK